MGEIDRINPILRPLLQPKLTDRVQPAGAEKRDQRHYQDSVELGSRAEADEEHLDEAEEPEQPETSHGLDLSI
jgi:hypothetical protein